jgi:N6-L-threonylcarbamoyladenine synthase
MNILAIETSCDETGIALLKASGGSKRGTAKAAPRFEVVENLVASQIKIHRPFGGVVPNLAKREHLKNLPILFNKIVRDHKNFKPDLVAVTVGPGLEPALWTGIEFAKVVAKEGKLPLVGANHLEGHLYSFLLPSRSSKSFASALIPKKIFPAIALIVSGGHTMLLKMDSWSQWENLGETRDDAAGEAYDKVARLLDLPYPGGPEVEKLAARGNSFAITFPRPMLDQRNYDFSFSGLKTAVRYYLENAKRGRNEHGRKIVPAARGGHGGIKVDKANVAAGFEQAVIDVLVAKTRRAAEEHAAESIILTGGVAANRHLRKALERTAGLIHCNFFVPDFAYNMDNAAMIGAAAYMRTLRNGGSAGGARSASTRKYPLVAKGDLGI